MGRWTKALLVLVSAGWIAAAADFGALRPTGYVNDFAKVLDPASAQQLEAYCAQVQNATGAQIAIVTLPSLEGEPIEDVANLLYRKWGVGSKKENEGVLLLLSIGDRRSRLEVGYGLEPIIPDGNAGGIIREMRPSLRAGNYDQALSDAAHTIAERIAQAKGVQIGMPAPLRHSRPGPENFPWEVLVVVGGLLLVMLFFGGGRSGRGGYGGGGGGGGFLVGMILGQLLGGGGSRTRGGGGFGGYDSGDSFGGFGGGDSGGGGASSDW
ncbi:TPM domain-containing protein [uncultured Paludibaculum sp.]|uniref:TPM domain-containing protein n=1 Tax=uncultured Paludibaculum sp. TaxID=1765020 RepID=UPI002AAAE0FA|nr:TPM domain-containing protein [uncultured Paludibaculum sp.]